VSIFVASPARSVADAGHGALLLVSSPGTPLLPPSGAMPPPLLSPVGWVPSLLELGTPASLPALPLGSMPSGAAVMSVSWRPMF
jgi:hypothetical protein